VAPAVRLGLSQVRGLRREAGQRIVAERARARFAGLQELVDRCGLRRDELETLAAVGALNAFGLTRRSALWQVEKAGRPRGPLLRDAEPVPGVVGEAGGDASPLPEMGLVERLESDVRGTGLSIGRHPVALFRPQLQARGVRRARDLEACPDGAWLRVAGAVICRQRPGTAKGFLFLTLEDETGLVNVTVRPDLFDRCRDVLVASPVLEVEGRLQAREGVSVRAEQVRSVLVELAPLPARNFC